MTGGRHILRVVFALFLCLAAVAVSRCSDGETVSDAQKLLMLSLLDPCLYCPYPKSGHGLAEHDLSGYDVETATVIGRVVTASGAPVNGAVVIVDNNIQDDAVYYSSYSGLDRNGIFEISGIKIEETSFILGVQAVNRTDTLENYAGRIDSHMDCASPLRFTPGWYRGSGSTISTVRGSATTISLTGGQVYDAGTLVLME